MANVRSFREKCACWDCVYEGCTGACRYLMLRSKGVLGNSTETSWALSGADKV